MAVIYLIFNEGYAATAGERLDAARPGERGDAAGPDAGRRSPPTSPRCSDCRRCWRSRARGWPPGSTSTARRCCWRRRTGRRWDQLLIRRGLAALQQAELLAARGKPVGKYFLQAVDRRAARPRRAGRGHRLAPDRERCTTSWPRPRRDRSSRSTGRSRTGGRSARTPGSPCSTELDAGRARRLAAAAERARRPARAGRAARRGGRGVHRGGRAHPERGRARGAAAAGRGEPGARVEIRLTRSTHG